MSMYAEQILLLLVFEHDLCNVQYMIFRVNMAGTCLQMRRVYLYR